MSVLRQVSMPETSSTAVLVTDDLVQVAEDGDSGEACHAV